MEHKKYKFQGQSTRSINSFDLDHEWLEEIFRTREPDFYEKIHQKYIRGHDTKTYKLFVVPIDNAKITKNIVFHPADPVLKYHQKFSNSSCLISLASAFHGIGDNKAVTTLVNHIE